MPPVMTCGRPGDGNRAMTLGISEVREIVERAFRQQDVLNACARRDLGRVIMLLGAHGLTQGRISELTGISQGRLSEWANRKRRPRATSTFEAFADGLGLPTAAREALGLAVSAAGQPGPPHPPPPVAWATSTASARPMVAGLRSPDPAPVPAQGVAALLPRETVRAPLDDVMAALRAQQSRQAAGLVIRRPVWKNLVFTGGPGTGKSRAAVAVGQDYRELGVLASGHVIEVTAADLTGATPGETGKLVAEAVHPASGGILLINAAHDWQLLPDRGRQVLRRLYDQLSEYRAERLDELAVILAGQAAPLQGLLHSFPALAARFRAVVDFPGFRPGELAVIFGSLAGESGLTLTPAAGIKAAGVLARAEGGYGSGSARLAVRLLNQATRLQARRVAAALGPGQDPAAPDTLTEADIPDQLHAEWAPAEEGRPGLYLLPGAGTDRFGSAGPWRISSASGCALPLLLGSLRILLGRQVRQGPLAVDEAGQRPGQGGGLVGRDGLEQAVVDAVGGYLGQQPLRLVRGAKPLAVLGSRAQDRRHVGSQFCRAADHRVLRDRCVHRVGDYALERPSGQGTDRGQDVGLRDRGGPAGQVRQYGQPGPQPDPRLVFDDSLR
jgi:ATPase family associated with various cellular activities (AAA)